MKALLVGEYRDGKVLDATYELIAFAQSIGAESAMFIAGGESDFPKYEGKLYLADAAKYGEFNPDVHKKLVASVIAKESPDLIVFSHSYYGWDLAPRIAYELKCAQVSEAVGYENGSFIVPACNSKMRRSVKPKTGVAVVTVQSGAFNPPSGPADEPSGTPSVEKID
ncbi:MAG: electron transfer flavoprotein subunit alpha/FixB family protein, partial [Nitrospinota bacterium]